MTVAVSRSRGLPRGYLVAAAAVPLLALLATGLLIGLRPPSGVSGASVGRPAPDFALVDLAGNPIRLSELRGRPVLINFWASWCGPCVEEFPRIEAALDEHGASGLAVIGIVYQDRWSSADRFMDQMGASWPAAMDPGGRVADRYGVYGAPESFFIDRDGVVAARQFGPFTSEALARHLALIMEESL